METEHRKKQTGEQPPDVGQKEKDDDDNKHQKAKKDSITTKDDQDTIPEKCDKDNEPTTQEMYEALELAKRMDETKQKRTNTNA